MVSNSTILVLSAVSGTVGLVIITAISLYLWKRNKKRRAVSSDEQLDDIESGSHNDRPSEEKIKKTSGKVMSKTLIAGQMGNSDGSLARKEMATKESQNTSERESYPKFVTLFTVGIESVSKPSIKKNNAALRSKSLKSGEKSKTIEIKRHETFCAPLTSKETIHEKVTRSDSMVNTFTDRSKQLNNLKKHITDSTKPSDAPLSRKPSRCWEDMTSEISDIINQDDSNTDDSNADDDHPKIEEYDDSKETNGIQSESSISDNISYVVDPINKTFVLSEKVQRVNEQDLDTSNWDSGHSDLEDGDGDSFASVTLTDFENSDNSSELKTVIEVKSAEPHDHPTSFLSKTDENNLNKRPQTAQGTEEIEQKKATTLYRCKSIPSNARFNYSTNNLQDSQTNDSVSIKNSNCNLPIIIQPVGEDSVKSTAKSNKILSKSTVSDIVSAELNMRDSKSLAESSVRFLAKKHDNNGDHSRNEKLTSVPDFQIAEEVKPSEFHGLEGHNALTNLKNKESENNVTTESTVSDIKCTDSTTSWNPTLQRLKDGDTQYNTEGIMSNCRIETSNKLQKSPPVVPGHTEKSFNEDTVYKTDLINATLSLHHAISKKEMPESRSRKRKFSELRAPTPIPTSNAKPKRGILKKNCDGKLTLQIKIPDDKETNNEHDETTQERLNVINEDACDQVNSSESYNELHSKRTIVNNISLSDANLKNETRKENRLITTKTSMRATGVTIVSTVKESNDENNVIVTEASPDVCPDISLENTDDHLPDERQTRDSLDRKSSSDRIKVNSHPQAEPNISIVTNGSDLKTIDLKIPSLPNHADSTSVENVQIKAITQLSSSHTPDTRQCSDIIAHELTGANSNSNETIEQVDQSTTESTVLSSDSNGKKRNEAHKLVRDVSDEHHEILHSEKETKLAMKDFQTEVLQQSNEVKKEQPKIDHIKNTINTPVTAEHYAYDSLYADEKNLHKNEHNWRYLDLCRKEELWSVKDGYSEGLKGPQIDTPRDTNIKDENQCGVGKWHKNPSESFSKPSKPSQSMGQSINRTDSYHISDIQMTKGTFESLEPTRRFEERESCSQRRGEDINFTKGNYLLCSKEVDQTTSLSKMRKSIKDKALVNIGGASIIGHQTLSKLTDVEGTEYNESYEKNIPVSFLGDKEEHVQNGVLLMSDLSNNKVSNYTTEANSFSNDILETNKSNIGSPTKSGNSLDMADCRVYHGNMTGNEKRSRKNRRSKSLPGNARKQREEIKTKLKKKVSGYRETASVSKTRESCEAGCKLQESVPFPSGNAEAGNDDTIRPKVNVQNSKKLSVTVTDLELPSAAVITPPANNLNSDSHKYNKSAFDIVVINRVSEANTKGKAESGNEMNEIHKNGTGISDREKNMAKGSRMSSTISQSFPADHDNNSTSTGIDYPSTRSNRPKSAKGRSRNELNTTTVTVSGLEETDKSELPAEQLSVSSNIGLKRNETFKTRLERRERRKPVLRSKSLGSSEKDLAKSSSKPLKEFAKPITIENSTFFTNRSRYSYSDRGAENTVDRITSGISSEIDNFEQDKYLKNDKQKSEGKKETDVILQDAILYSENRSIRERPKSSYGRSRVTSQNDSKERLLRRRPTSASDLAASRRSDIARTKDYTPRVSYPSLDDTLSDAGNSSDGMEEVKLLESSSIPRSLKSLTKTRESHGYGQFISHEQENRSSKRSTIKNESHLMADKASRVQNEIKRSSSVYESHKSMSTSHPGQRSSTLVPNSRSKQADLDTINETLRKTFDGLKTTTTSLSYTNSIADRIRERLTPTSHNQSSQIEHGHQLHPKEFPDHVVSNVRAQVRLSRSKTVGVGDKYTSKSANQTDRQAVLNGSTVAATDFLPAYKTRNVMEVSLMENTPEKPTERNRYSHHMRSKSFNFN